MCVYILALPTFPSSVSGLATQAAIPVLTLASHRISPSVSSSVQRGPARVLFTSVRCEPVSEIQTLHETRTHKASDCGALVPAQLGTHRHTQGSQGPARPGQDCMIPWLPLTSRDGRGSWYPYTQYDITFEHQTHCGSSRLLCPPPFSNNPGDSHTPGLPDAGPGWHYAFRVKFTGGYSDLSPPLRCL